MNWFKLKLWANNEVMNHNSVMNQVQVMNQNKNVLHQTKGANSEMSINRNTQEIIQV